MTAAKIDAAEPPTNRVVFSKTPIHRCGSGVTSSMSSTKFKKCAVSSIARTPWREHSGPLRDAAALRLTARIGDDRSPAEC